MTTLRGERVLLVQTGDEPLVHEVSTEPLPALASDGVLVEVEACGVCYRDLIDRAGRFPFQQVPIVPGHEAVGRVVSVGASVKKWKVGDRVATMHRDACGECAPCRTGQGSLCEGAAWVFGILKDGGYARRLVAPESALFSAPGEMAAAEAAVMHCTFGTAYRDLATLGGLRSGERMLVTGANGGVGSAAVQIGVRLGAEVVAVVRDAQHTEYLKSLGAAHVVVDAGSGFHHTLPGGFVDVALEAVGASTFNSSLRSLKLGGRLVVVGNIVPDKVPLNLGFIITRGLRIIGGSGAVPEEMAKVFALHRERPFVVPINRTLPLAEAEEAQRLVRAGGLHGRVVLVPAA